MGILILPGEKTHKGAQEEIERGTSTLTKEHRGGGGRKCGAAQVSPSQERGHRLRNGAGN